MTTSGIRLGILASILLLFTSLVQATAIGSVSGSTVTLTAGKMDGVQVGMTALVYGITNMRGKATEVTIAKVQLTAVNDRSCTASILEQSADATMPKISAGQKVVFQQALVPPSGNAAAELGNAKPEPPPPPPKDPYAGVSPLELSAKADAAYSAGRYDEADGFYSAVLRAVPDDPLASQRLKDISGRKQQAEAEAKRRAEKEEKLKNADFFLTRGDDAYRSGDYATAANYYTKVAEADESYRDAGVKCWLSKARTAKAKGDTTALREARGKLKGMSVPGSLTSEFSKIAPPAIEVRINSKDGLEYVKIPSGTFQMGCVSGDSLCIPSEKPRHTVTVSKGFWMTKTEVTVAAYKRFCSATRRKMPPAPLDNADWQNEDKPIVTGHWDDANAYCEWVGGRLPTEAEWEYAARAGTETVYYWGNSPDGAYTWYSANSGKESQPIGQKEPNEWGLYDMAGNAAEWCFDWYEASYYSNSPGTDPTGAGSGKYRVLRGGWCGDTGFGLRLSARMAVAPVGWFYGGIRCLRDTAP